MTVTRIVEVAKSPKLDDAFHGFELSEPKPGSEHDIYSVKLAGWALGRNVSMRCLDLMIRTVCWKSIPLAFSIPEVAAAFPNAMGKDTCGFRSAFGVLGLPPTFRLEMVAVFRNSERRKCGEIVAVHDPLRTSYESKLRPLIVTSLARTGTTRLMQMLSRHPAIVMNPHYPLEGRPACYWLHMLKVLAEPANSRNTFEADLSFLPPSPSNCEPFTDLPAIKQWFGKDYVIELAEFSKRIIDQCYTRLAEQQQRANAVHVFAEKCLPCHLQWLFHELYPNGREVVLVRDFRDMVCSMIAFNKKRHFAAFGRENVETDTEFIRAKQADAQRLVDVLRDRKDSVLCVHYEDLVLEPERTLRRILNHLELSSTDGVLGQMIDDASEAFAFHRTTPSDVASLGRWKRDLDPRLQTVCHDVFADLLMEAGYT